MCWVKVSLFFMITTWLIVLDETRAPFSTLLWNISSFLYHVLFLWPKICFFQFGLELFLETCRVFCSGTNTNSCTLCFKRNVCFNPPAFYTGPRGYSEMISHIGGDGLPDSSISCHRMLSGPHSASVVETLQRTDRYKSAGCRLSRSVLKTRHCHIVGFLMQTSHCCIHFLWDRQQNT